MRKLSVIIALALVITIGGVYAAWHYNRGEVSLEITRSATMASIQSDTAKGSVAIDKDGNGESRNTLKFLVDDLDTIDWKAELVPSGSVFVKFTPAANADQTVKDNGIKMMATVTVTGDKTLYNGVEIFKAKDGANTFVINDTASLEVQEITAAQIAACLEFNEGQDIYLLTYDQNVAYEKAMKTYVITITITEVPANS